MQKCQAEGVRAHFDRWINSQPPRLQRPLCEPVCSTGPPIGDRRSWFKNTRLNLPRADRIQRLRTTPPNRYLLNLIRAARTRSNGSRSILFLPDRATAARSAPPPPTAEHARDPSSDFEHQTTITKVQREIESAADIGECLLPTMARWRSRAKARGGSAVRTLFQRAIRLARWWFLAIAASDHPPRHRRTLLGSIPGTWWPSSERSMAAANSLHCAHSRSWCYWSMAITEVEEESSRVCGASYRGEVEKDLTPSPLPATPAHPPCAAMVVEVFRLTSRVHWSVTHLGLVHAARRSTRGALSSVKKQAPRPTRRRARSQTGPRRSVVEMGWKRVTWPNLSFLLSFFSQFKFEFEFGYEIHPWSRNVLIHILLGGKCIPIYIFILFHLRSIFLSFSHFQKPYF
jgi:hypothetical protein